jgi:hypothetical protein
MTTPLITARCCCAQADIVANQSSDTIIRGIESILTEL